MFKLVIWHVGSNRDCDVSENIIGEKRGWDDLRLLLFWRSLLAVNGSPRSTMYKEELFNECVLNTSRTPPRYPALNIGTMSISSRQTGRLSLNLRKPATQTASLLRVNRNDLAWQQPYLGVKRKMLVDSMETTFRNIYCHLCGLPEKLVFGTMEIHIKNCNGDFQKHTLECPSGVDCCSMNPDHYRELSHKITEPFKVGFTTMSKRKNKDQDNLTNSISPAFKVKDCNHNTIFSKMNQTKSVSQETPSAALKNKPTNGPRQLQQSGQSYICPSQGTSMSFSMSESLRNSRCDKPSAVLKRNKLKAHVARPKQLRPLQSFSLRSLSPISETQPWPIERMLRDFVDDDSSKKIVEDELKRRPKKRKVRKRVGDFTYIEGGTTTEEDSDSERQNGCPIFKRIPGTDFAVDALCYGEDPQVRAHFLTRFRKENRQCGTTPIYCTAITASLTSSHGGFEKGILRVLELGEPRIIDGMKVTAIDAHNEPGSAVLLFQLPGDYDIAYFGDLRANSTIESFPAFWSPKFQLDYLFIDTSCCNHDIDQLPREEMESSIHKIVDNHMKNHPNSPIAVVSDGLLDIPVVDGSSFADVKRLVKFFRPRRLISPLKPRHDEIQSKFLKEWLDDPWEPVSNKREMVSRMESKK